MSSLPTVRLEAWISADLHAVLKRAAELQGRTMNDFVVAAMQAAAEQVIEQSEAIRLSVAEQQRFAAALLQPPPMAAALQQAFARQGRILRQD